MIRTHSPRLMLGSVVAATLAWGGFAAAETVAYWQFENAPGFLADSAGANTLTNAGGVTQVAAPGVYPVFAGSSAANFSGSSSSLTAADNAAFTSNTLTLEAIVTPDTLQSSGSRLIAGHHYSGAGASTAIGSATRSYFLGVSEVGGSVFPRVNITAEFPLGDVQTPSYTMTGDGTALVAGNSYYIAVVVDLGLTGGEFTMYLKDLTTDGDLIVQSFDSDAVNLLDANAVFSIGSTAQGSANFDGLIDQVRLSNTALTVSELLVPEPASLVLLGLGGAALLARRRTA